jgi:hypothetical protein
MDICQKEALRDEREEGTVRFSIIDGTKGVEAFLSRCVLPLQ